MLLRVGAWLAALAWLAGCASPPATEGRPVIAVSVLPQAWFVERLAGDFAEVTVMIPAGANEATYEPTVAQMKAVSDAAVYVEVGHPNFAFERAWLSRLLGGNDRVMVVDGSAGTRLKREDPHVWLSAEHAAAMCRNVHRALVERFPERRAGLDAALADVVAEIDGVDHDVRSMLEPYAGRAFVVVHPAWGYFADAYGLEQLAIEHEGKEPSPAALGALFRRMRDEKIRVVFAQPQFSRAEAEMVARETGARVEVVDPLGRDWPAVMRGAARALAASFRD
jgi:zinc transport system substrate-binding protein